VLAGPAPIIAVGLVGLAGGAPWWLALGMAVVAVASFAAVAVLPETRGVDLAPMVTTDTPAGKAPAVTEPQR